MTAPDQAAEPDTKTLANDRSQHEKAPAGEDQRALLASEGA